MPSCTVDETFHRVTTQPGSTAKKWDREELIRCRAIETGTTTKTDLQGQVHPLFENWVDTKSKLRNELEQPILLASKILETVGLPWLSDFLIDDIFDENYPGRARGDSSTVIPAQEKNNTPHSIVRHHRIYGATREKKSKWKDSARNTLRNDLPKLIQWQLDEDIFRERGWNGYTCRHPRGNLPISSIDKYKTIEKFDNICPHKGSRNLTILITTEFPARLAELRRQGKARSEEYLLTAFMATVTILHELGHAIYWKDRRSLAWGLREPFYGADLEMELGDSFVAAIFGGWIPCPVRDVSRLREDFSFADGIAWRQALNWDHHRMRPKYRAHYSISVDYIAHLFTEADWSVTVDKAADLVRPKFLTGNSMALRTVGLYSPLEESNRHATAAIADFHCHNDGWVWNRRPGAWFRIPQYDGCMYPELQLPRAGEEAICPPLAKEVRRTTAGRVSALPPLSPTATRAPNEGQKTRMTLGVVPHEMAGITTHAEAWRGGEDALLPLLVPRPLNVTTAAGVTKMKLNPRKSEYSPRKFARGSPTTRMSPPSINESRVMQCDLDVSVSRKRNCVITSPLARGRAIGSHSQQEERGLSRSQGQTQGEAGEHRLQDPGANPRTKPRPLREDEDTPCTELSGNNHDHDHDHHYLDDDDGGHDRSEISVDELKKRLSQLIGLSLLELEKLLDGPERRTAASMVQ
ncbi:hypothetical protein F5Y01DRAFT_327281 [Xylaria sp. FL0043]|nr:hypothetical protein F5Y01DRAFT_327281 [Xylaria sp. FL0043]